VINPETEQFLRLEELRRRIDLETRRFMMQFIAAIVLAFSLGVWVGRFWR
jgi:hypothetical protein